MGIRDAVARCESIGRNCEFGLVQRHFGLEPIGLLRWAGMPLPALIRALRTRFAGVGQDMQIWREANVEWWGTCRNTGLHVHCATPLSEPEEVVLAQEARRLPRLAGKLFEDIANGEKTLVYSNKELQQPEDAYDLLIALREIGRGPVLIVAEGSEEPPHLIGRNAWGARLPILTDMGGAGDIKIRSWERLMGAFACSSPMPHPACM